MPSEQFLDYPLMARNFLVISKIAIYLKNLNLHQGML